MPDKLHQLIELCAQETALPLITIEKDYYLTQVIHLLSDIQNEHFSFVFQGGTALAKAHQIVERMSEDCDFRIHMSEAAKKLSKSQKRVLLRDFRHCVIEKIEASGLTLNEKETKTKDEGNYQQLSLIYPSQYQRNETLRPHIQIEMMLNQSKLIVETRSVTTLIRHIMGEKIDHPQKSIPCVSVTETAAEKWVALTRRVANGIKRPEAFLDPALVRHIYDLHCICEQNQLATSFYLLIEDLIIADSKKYKNQNPDYVRDPFTEIRSALSSLPQNIEWERRWQNFMESMVYGENKPDYSSALASLNKLSNQVFNKFENSVFAII